MVSPWSHAMSVICLLQHGREHITESAWRIQLNAQPSIAYRSHYSLLFKTTIEMDYFFTF